MSISFTSPLPLAAGGGFTSATGTLVTDKGPDLRSSQVMVSAIGGTATNLRYHRPSDPFTLTLKNPVRQVAGPNVDANGNVIGTVPMVAWTLLTRKGVYVANGNQVRTMIIRTEVLVPAGADSFDSPNVKGGWLLHAGAIADRAGSIADAFITGNFA